MKIKLYILVLYLIISTPVLFAQKNYVPGKVFTNENDTISGLIDYRNWEKNPDVVSFQRETGEVGIYTPLDIHGFEVNNEVYISAVVDLEISPFRANELTDDPALNIKVDTTFLLTIFEGRKSLYSNISDNGVENFYIKNGIDFELLVYKIFLKKGSYSSVKAENKKFIGQLKLYLNDCSSLDGQLSNLRYTQGSLVSLFKDYYSCVQSFPSYAKKKDRAKVSVGSLVGLSLTSINFKSEEFEALTNTDFKNSVRPALGVFIDFGLKRNNEKWSINNELLFTTYKFSEKYERYQNADNSYSTSMELGFSYLKVNNMVRYAYPLARLHAYINVGMSNGIVIKETNSQKGTMIINTVHNSRSGKIIEDVRKHEQGFLIGTGLRHRNHLFELRYEMGNGMSKLVSLNSQSRALYVLWAFRF
ncbi:hypothetical protein C900_03262 [Fulvivirga imtechensis AK7]|uniref:Uncharacterized protein n=1 Tax=Fulvivirga imtechensis AK7 TaxID=1237149 RepID=L8JU58_9BACT|nr:outer membrane beta-barrel protein [Fulvivirga imtechensis]ELR70827.1 hypothetical protein C900_03262 [Fulvivirga imtechensis AK7]